MRAAFAFSLVLALGGAESAQALSLPQAIALAQRSNASLQQVRAQADAAEARFAQARAGGRPSLTLSGELAQGSTDLGGFFGFGRADVTPRSAALELRQSVFSGGAFQAGVEGARRAHDAVLAQVAGAQALISAQAAEAYAAVLTATEMVSLNQAHLAHIAEIVRQTDLRFEAGEVPASATAGAQARLAEARAGLVRAQGDAARSRARFAALVGAEAEGLEPLPGPPPTPATLGQALQTALETSPAIIAATASEEAARATVRQAEAERLPSLAFTARAASARDQFFPGYRADSVTIGLQGRWTLFSGGLVRGRISEARAQARGAQSALEAARAKIREAVIGGWEDVETSQALLEASAARKAATAQALDSVRHEVRVGEKGTADLLEAEQDALEAETALAAARANIVVAAYRLNALIAP